MTCWFCRLPAVSVGYGFAICDQGRCNERARTLFQDLTREVIDRWWRK